MRSEFGGDFSNLGEVRVNMGKANRNEKKESEGEIEEENFEDWVHEKA